jgi:SAM-dependent methyltransferase
MNQKTCKVMIDVAAKFHSYLYIEGWFSCPGDKLVDILIDGADVDFIKKTIGFDSFGVLSTLGPKLGFKVELAFNIAPKDYFKIELKFIGESGTITHKNLGELTRDRLGVSPSLAVGQKFISLLNKISESGRVPKVLDLGGRNGSGVDRSLLFPNCEVVVLDILQGDNVDVVGDAHELSKLFPPNHFDAVFSVSVFEHLLMPWKVVTEINKVLKSGGVGIVFTHQSLGMHDLPWDFYRFSDTAWDGLFNQYTGFNILDRCLDYTQFVLPFILRQDKLDAEKSAGFEGSTVLFEKTAETDLTWDVTISSVTKTMYPNTTEKLTQVIKNGIIKIFN